MSKLIQTPKWTITLNLVAGVHHAKLKTDETHKEENTVQKAIQLLHMCGNVGASVEMSLNLKTMPPLIDKWWLRLLINDQLYI